MAKGTINKVILLGRLGADPEVRQTPSGVTVTNLRIATNDGYKDRNSGQFVETTEWHRVVLFARQAEVASEYCKKGSLVYIEGRIRTNKWQDQQGMDRYTTEVIANELQLIGSRSDMSYDNGGAYDRAGTDASADKAEVSKESQAVPSLAELDKDFNDDEIPF
ncbi:single-stranded DNA-binding protein [Thiotrichales bacterium 19S9-12]|nr:single-stranded DNA-binding protein [Thiotrichales bacterium 19S9-11]MCF6811474.1 single-stranded DNA-binding protein [Thiotrichales bacterium 19S9-12]